jgi:hypothetical protein
MGEVLGKRKIQYGKKGLSIWNEEIKQMIKNKMKIQYKRNCSLVRRKL